MLHFTEQRLDELFTRFQGKRIAVVGDLMLDRYMWGTVSRISPEAPVPVVEMDQDQARLGGAANVAQNIKSLGGEPFLIGVIGNDNSGKHLLEQVHGNKFSADGVIVDAGRPTTVKTRIIADNQHVVRIDRESRADISPVIEQSILDILERNKNSLDGIIIEDYNKGVVTTSLIKKVVQFANANNKIITIDPKFNNFFEYADVTVFKPNRKETEEALVMRIHTDDDILQAGKTLLKRLRANSVLLTLGEKGMTLFEKDNQVTKIPTIARKVADVSGAGDTVIATLTIALAGGASNKEAASLSNYAGGIVCSYVGIVPINKDELRNTILDNSSS